MAQLFPADFEVSGLEYSEQRVVQALVDGLAEHWVVMPSVPVVDGGRDAEIDVVLASPTHGVVVVEVKGGRISVRDGIWSQNDRPLKRPPTEQITRAKHLLTRRMRTIGIDLDGLFVRHVIALPDVGEIPAVGFGTDAPADILLGARELAFPDEAISRVQREHGPVPPERFARFLAALRPGFTPDPADLAAMPIATRRIDRDTRMRIGALSTLDTNARVLVTGGAGSGKTWLVVEWARRAAQRGERTLVLTFNKPLADHLARVLADAAGVHVHTYHDLVVHLAGPFGFRLPEGRIGREYWETEPTAALLAHADDVGTPFDTIIVDEGQDMRPHWLGSIEMLLDPQATPPRLLMVADPTQAIYVAPWQPPPGMMTAVLAQNLRSARSVAEVVARLGGPEPLPDAPGRVAVTHLRAGGTKEVRKRVRATIEQLTAHHGVPLSQIAVLTLRTEVRDDLLDPAPEIAAGREPLPLARWEERSEDTALCETVHRGKGLERPAVIVVDITTAPEPQLVYIGASRAMWSLTLVGRDELAAVAGISPQV